MSIDYGYIRAVLARFEGGGITRGYVPSKNGVALGVSGVTIGTGVDLGQQTGAALWDMSVPHGVVKKLLPYMGLKKEAARAALQRQPLTLSKAEVKALDDAVIGRYVRNIAAFYNKNLPAQTFDLIPREAQAVLVSVLYQRGLGYAPKVPALWRALLAGEWASAAAWLVDPANGGGYHSRRKAEGEILRSIGLDKARDADIGAASAAATWFETQAAQAARTMTAIAAPIRTQAETTVAFNAAPQDPAAAALAPGNNKKKC